MAEKSSTYFIPPELRKHVQLIKELPEIVANTVTDPDTYVALNELLNPVKWIESAGQKSGKFFESGGKDIESGAEALIETLGLAAGPMAQKYASTLAPMVSRGVGSGVKSLQELVMPLGATDDVAKKIPQKEGISRRDFIAGGTALGTLAGLKQAGDLLPTTKGAVKVAAKTPLASTIKALNSIKSNYKKVSNERKLIEDSIFDLKSNPSKWVEDTYSAYKEHTPEELLELKKLEKLSDTTEMKVIKSVDSMEEKIGSLVSSLLKYNKKDLMKLNDDQLKSLRGHLTDNYYYSGFGTTKYVKFRPSDEASIFKKPVDPKDFFKTDLADKTRIRKLTSSKESSEKTDYEKIVLRVDEVLEERGLTTIEDVNKLKERSMERIKNLPISPLARPEFYNQGGLTTDKQTQQAFNQGGTTMEQQMSLFEEGGMKDDGLDRDPVSGNEIPPGSLAKEVRDDIPAQLSDGEYVVPADVVQYFGVKFFEDIRAEAKRGLAEMEATGRIGGEPVEVDMTMIAFGQKDKDKKEKKATGGVVGFDNGGVSADQEAINKSQPKFDIEDYAVPGFTPGSSIYQVRSGVQTSAKPTSTVVYRTYYGPNNEVKSVPGTLDANGNWNADQGFEEFVKSPWTNTPKQQVSSSRDGSGPSALELEAQRRQNEYALGVSAKRLGIPLEEYKDLSLGKRFKLMGQEIQVMSGGKADPKIVKSILDGKDDGFNFTDLIGFIFNPIGSVIKLATSFIAGTDISDSPASNVNLKNKLNLNQSSSKNILPIPSTKSSGVDTSTIKGIEKASKKSDKSDKDDQRRQDAEDAKQSRAGPQTGTTPAQAAKKAKTESFREKEAQSLTKSVGTAGASKTAADITRDVMGGDLNKGGLATRTKKRKNKK